MNITVAAMWAQALRSGKYQKTRHELKNERGFCALGVLCDLAAENGLGHWVDAPDSPVSRFAVREAEYLNCLPPEVSHWAALKPYTTDIIAKKNDGIIAGFWDEGRESLSFEELADWIDENAELI